MQKVERIQLANITGGLSTGTGSNKTSSSVNVNWNKDGGTIVITPGSKS